MLQESFYFRSENEIAVCNREIKGLYTYSIADKNKPIVVGVPYCNGKHAEQLVDKTKAILLVGIEDGFCVRSRAVAIPFRFELLSEDQVIVDFSVHHERELAVWRVHRLMTGRRKIDDRETSKAESDLPIRRHEYTGIVRTAMSKTVAHPDEERFVKRRDRITVAEDAADAAHESSQRSKDE